MRLAAARQRPGAHVAAVGRRADAVRAAGGHVAEAGLGGAQHRVGVDRAGHADDQVGAAVLARDVVEQLGAADALDQRARADHRLRRRVQAEAGVVEQPVGGVHRVVLDLGEFVQQHLALALELVGGEGRRAHDVGQHRDEVQRMPGQPAHLERGVVLVGMREHLGAQALGVEVDAVRVACGRALERHMLDDMADPGQRARLVRAAAAHEDAGAGGGQVRQRQHGHAHAVGQGRDCGDGAMLHRARILAPDGRRCCLGFSAAARPAARSPGLRPGP